MRSVTTTPLALITWAALAGSVGGILAGCGTAASPPPTATPSPTPTATLTPSPSPTPRPTAVPDQTLIRNAVKGSNAAYVSSLACACDSGLETFKTGRDLQKYLNEVQSLQVSNQHVNITAISFSIHAVTLGSSSSATVDVTKDEIARTYTNGSLTATCSSPYDLEYFLQKIGGAWKVSDTNVTSGGC